MGSRPTGALNTVLEWCTTLANRIEPKSELRARGFSAELEDPVPDGVHNYLFGVATAWAKWLQDSAIGYTGGNTVWIPLGSAAWTTRYDGSDALTEIRMRTAASPEDDPGTYTQLTSLTGAAGDARWVGTVMMGGTPATCALFVSTSSGVSGTYDALVRVYDPASNPATPAYTYREWEVTGSSSTGQVALPLVSGSPSELNGPVGVEVIIKPSAGGGYVRVQALRFNFSTTDPA